MSVASFARVFVLVSAKQTNILLLYRCREPPNNMSHRISRVSVGVVLDLIAPVVNHFCGDICYDSLIKCNQ